VTETVGSWAAEVAKEFPTTKVIGMDISPIIHLKELPKNLEFVFGDLTSDLDLFQDDSIDLAHSR
jgi:ubiquinone/menaquinone biosynthesis C-methylase UbiE